MIEREKISQIVEGYDKDSIRIGALGSHSALDICRGAKDEGFQTLVICQRGRERPYSHYYRTKGIFKEERGIVDEVIVLEAFSEMLRPEIQNELRKRATIFIPHRSFTVYVPYDGIENELRLPIFGSRNLLRAEERDSTKNQYYLLRKAGIRIPAMFKSHEEIDRLVIVKVPEAQRRYERSFFYASTPKEFEQVSKEMLKRGAITESDLESATIEEFIVGAQFNFNYFYSPLLGELELLGIDTRRQTNLEGLLRLPSNEQLKVLRYLGVKNIEIGHLACTIRESLLEQVFDIGERFVKTCKKEYSPGIIGPFALQGAVLPGPPREEIVIFDVSLRVPGSPGTKFTPYTECRWGHPISTGRRIAIEIREAIKEGRLGEVVT